jgi:hypothetical protein
MSLNQVARMTPHMSKHYKKIDIGDFDARE